MVNPNPPWFAAYKARTDLSEFGDNALGLFALATRFNLDDLASITCKFNH